MTRFSEFVTRFCTNSTRSGKKTLNLVTLPGVEDIVENGVTIQVEALGNQSETVGTEGVLGVDVDDLQFQFQFQFI